MLIGGWLFPGLNHIDSLSVKKLNRAIHEAALIVKPDKQVPMDTWWHSFVTHLQEKKVNIQVIQVHVGHKRLSTTAHKQRFDRYYRTTQATTI